MARITTQQNKFESNQQTESQSFGIGDPSVVIEILRNRLYEHKIRTLVQEYMSNARDAHREIGQAKRIQVTAPTHFDATFKVRDFGPGISPDRMANVFVLYGASTKRQNQNQTGGFGIGAKSAWSYADGFIITSIVDGTKRVYHAHVGSSNVGQLDLLETTSTDESNGCEIQIAVNPKDITEFQNSIQRACYFWNDSEMPELTNIVPATKPKTYDLGHLSILSRNESFPTFLNLYGRSDILVVDGIPYNLTRDLVDKTPAIRDLQNVISGSCIIRIPNGIVQVSASREKLDDSDFTRKGLTKVGVKILNEVKDHVDAKIKAIDSVKGFIDTYRSMYTNFVMSENEYKGFKFDGEYLYTKNLASLNFRQYKVFNGKVKDNGVKGIPFADLDKIYLLTKQENTVTFNRRIRSIVSQRGPVYVISERPTSYTDTAGTVQQFNFDIPPAKAMKELQTVLGKFHDFHAITFTLPPKTPKAAKAARLASFHPIHFLDGYGRYTSDRKIADMVASSNEYVFIAVSDWTKERRKVDEIVREFGRRESDKGTKPVFIAVSNTVLELIKDEANFTDFSKYSKDLKLTDDLRLRMMAEKAINVGVIDILSHLEGVKNKKLTKLVDQYKLFKKASSKAIPESLKNRFKDDAEYQKFLAQDVEFKKLISDEYPLLKHLSSYSLNAEMKREVTWYLNNK